VAGHRDLLADFRPPLSSRRVGQRLATSHDGPECEVGGSSPEGLPTIHTPPLARPASAVLPLGRSVAVKSDSGLSYFSARYASHAIGDRRPSSSR
jgi:hypothetical protein